MWTSPTANAASFNGAAVVRPRRDEEEIADADETLGFNGAAVVRPRRARKSGTTRSRRRATLQRGRGRETAERATAHGGGDDFVLLQRGRGRETAERK